MNTCQVVETPPAVGAIRRHERIAGTAGAVCSRCDADAGTERRAGHGSAANFGFRRTIPQMLGITFGFGSMVPGHGARPRRRGPCRAAAACGAEICRRGRISSTSPGASRAPTPQRDRHAGRSASSRRRCSPGRIPRPGCRRWARRGLHDVGGDLLWESALIATVLAAFCLLSAALWAGFGTVIGRYLARPRARRVVQHVDGRPALLSLIPVLW